MLLEPCAARAAAAMCAALLSSCVALREDPEVAHNYGPPVLGSFLLHGNSLVEVVFFWRWFTWSRDSGSPAPARLSAGTIFSVLSFVPNVLSTTSHGCLFDALYAPLVLSSSSCGLVLGDKALQ